MQTVGLEESDNEFWTEFEEINVTHTENHMNNISGSSFKAFSGNIIKEVLSSSSIVHKLWSKEYYEDKMKRIRESKDPEIRSSIIKATNQIRRAYDGKIEYLTEKYSRDFQAILEEFLEIQHLLLIKDESNHNLIELLSDTGLLYSEARIASFSPKAPIHPKFDPEKEAMAQEICSLRTQVSALKELCEILRKETESAVALSRSLNQEFETFKSLSQEAERKHKEIIKSSENQLIELKQTMIKESLNLKNEFNIEAEARETIQDRQSKYISQLQDELKTAKSVLQNKYVRNKYYEALKDYNAEIKRTELKSRPSTSDHRRATSLSRPRPKPPSVLDSFFIEAPSKPCRTTTEKSKRVFPNKFSNIIFNSFDNTRPFTPNNY